jgi:hypothetical protein
MKLEERCSSRRIWKECAGTGLAQSVTSLHRVRASIVGTGDSPVHRVLEPGLEFASNPQRFALMQCKGSSIAGAELGMLCKRGTAGRSGIYKKESASRLLALTFGPALRQPRIWRGVLFCDAQQLGDELRGPPQGSSSLGENSRSSCPGAAARWRKNPYGDHKVVPVGAKCM